MKKFLVLCLTPPAVLEDWSKTEPETKKQAEEKMRAEWDKWMADHAGMIVDTWAGGKTKRVDLNGTSDTKNAILLYSIVEAESHEVAAQSFESHPHLQIPQATIEIMEIRPIEQKQ